MDNDFHYEFIKPDKSLANFVESFGVLHNKSAKEKEVVVLPDGRIDLFFSQSGLESFHVILTA